MRAPPSASPPIEVSISNWSSESFAWSTGLSTSGNRPPRESRFLPKHSAMAEGFLSPRKAKSSSQLRKRTSIYSCDQRGGLRVVYASELSRIWLASLPHDRLLTNFHRGKGN